MLHTLVRMVGVFVIFSFRLFVLYISRLNYHLTTTYRYTGRFGSQGAFCFIRLTKYSLRRQALSVSNFVGEIAARPGAVCFGSRAVAWSNFDEAFQGATQRKTDGRVTPFPRPNLPFIQAR